MRRLAGALVCVVVAGVVAAGSLGVLFDPGRRLDDRTAAPLLPGSALEVVANLDYPPGNVAVSADGRVFVTLHPDGDPPDKVVELVNGKPVPYPNAAFQQPAGDAPHFQSPLSLRADRQNRLWVLDYANYGLGQPRLLAFALGTNELVHRYDFPSQIAGLLSMLNDFQVDAAGERIYIADASPLPIRQTPALIVYDVRAQRARRVLERHPSVRAGDYLIQAPGRDMIIYGIYPLRIPVDSIALDRAGEWLYYGPVNGDRLYRIRTADLNDASLSPEELGRRVEDFAPKTLSDGLTTDLAGNVYLSDMEHSAVVLVGPDAKLTTLIKDSRLRWPDGFSFGPDGWLYVTCSALQHVLFVGADHMRANTPYQVFRFKPGKDREGAPGH